MPFYDIKASLQEIRINKLDMAKPNIYTSCQLLYLSLCGKSHWICDITLFLGHTIWNGITRMYCSLPSSFWDSTLKQNTIPQKVGSTSLCRLQTMFISWNSSWKERPRKRCDKSMKNIMPSHSLPTPGSFLKLELISAIPFEVFKKWLVEELKKRD